MHSYRSIYAELGFERGGLFETVRESFACRDVLYPGCSVHVTPSLYFPHIVYVDQSDAAEEFFANEGAILEFVNRHKHYRQSAYIRFIRQDYSRPLPLREEGFDLLLALFAGGIARSCTRYLKPGGLLLTNNHQGDAVDALRTSSLHLKATIRFKTGTYRIEANSLEDIPARRSDVTSLKQGSTGTAYVEKEIYYLFQRTH
jgi:hypothetical protein